MPNGISTNVLNQLFFEARTHNGWQDKPISAALLRQLYDTVKWAPTASNSQPARYVFIQSAAAKARLEPAMSQSNKAKTLAAPVTAIVAFDTTFYEHLPTQFPAYDARAPFAADPAMAERVAFRNSSMQIGYLILAARALGLDCGPMSGFNADKLNAEFFPDGRYKANVLINLGYGDPTKLHARGPRLNFEDVAEVL